MFKLLPIFVLLVLITNANSVRLILEEGTDDQNETIKDTQNVRSATGTKKCKDLDEDCFHFSQQGECTKNPKWMLENCKVSCSNCGGECQDYHHMCLIWRRSGECNLNPNFMHVHCPKACGTCHKVMRNASAHATGDDM